MILYFDNYITDTPFHAGGHETLGQVRLSSAKIYHMPSKLDITLYTLASYATLPWSHVIIKYELENIKQKRKFEKGVKELFPKAILLYGRSDSQKKFQESVKLIEKLKDEWIFYVGNNDHPLIASNLNTFNKCLKKAKELSKKHFLVSIAVSHFTEFYNKSRKGTPFHEMHNSDAQLLEENEDYQVALFPRGLNHSMLIVNLNLFKHWFFSGDSKGDLIRRSECMEPYIKTKNQYMVIPKKELCAHFDAEVPKSSSAYWMSYDIWVPLFIPPGFFKKNIKIRYAYDDYKPEWVNINPAKEKYSFRDSKNGTDMKIALEDIPLFWKKRIKEIDVNKNADTKRIGEALKKIYHIKRNPFPKKSSLYYALYRAKARFFVMLYSIPFIRGPIKKLLSKSEFLKKRYYHSRKIKL